MFKCYTKRNGCVNVKRKLKFKERLEHLNEEIMMFKCAMLASMLTITTVGMKVENYLLFDIKKPFTVKTIQDAYLKFIHHQLPIARSHDKKRMLSESLFILSSYWSDNLGFLGINLAKKLIEQGADPNFAHIEEELLETNGRVILVAYTLTAMRVAKGKLRESLKEYDLVEQDEY